MRILADAALETLALNRLVAQKEIVGSQQVDTMHADAPSDEGLAVDAVTDTAA